MLTSTLHLLYTIPALIASLVLLISYNKGGKKNKHLKTFSAFFLLFVFYRVSLSLYIFTNSIEIAAWGYNLAVVILLSMVAVAWDIPLSILGVKLRNRRIIEWTLVLISIIIVIIQIVDFRTPIIHPSGIILWNANPVTSFMTGLPGFVAAMTWVYTFGSSFNESKDKIDRLKIMLIIIGFFLIAIASMSYYYSNFYSLVTSFSTSFLGTCSLLTAVAVSYFKSHRKNRKLATS